MFRLLSSATIVFLCLVCGLSCQSSKLLYQEKLVHGKIIITASEKSGRKQITVEQRTKSKLDFQILYECECDKELLSVFKFDSARTWYAVTDTIGTPTFFNETILDGVLSRPYQYTTLSRQELSFLQRGIRSCGWDCCQSSTKPVERIVGFIKGRQ